MTKDTFMRGVFGFISLAVSAFFVYAGLFILITADFTAGNVLPGLLLLGYGIVNFVLLLRAWKGPLQRVRNLGRISAMVMFSVLVFGVMGAGLLSGGLIILVVGLLFWY